MSDRAELVDDVPWGAGRCYDESVALLRQHPELRLVRGWYDDLSLGPREHWWLEAPDGNILDPTRDQFGVGTYREISDHELEYGVCVECGAEFRRDEGNGATCSHACYGRMIGF